jgi:hypothetical protein
MIRTVQLSVHCRQNNAEYWVRHPNDFVVRRPWRLSCCQALDRSRCSVTSVDRWPRARTARGKAGR